MGGTQADTKSEREIRSLIDAWIKASLAKDIEGIMACYEPDVTAFDAIAELRFQGTEAYRKHWEVCFTYMQGEMTFEIHDLKLAVRDDLAFGHCLIHCGCTDENGKEQAGWMRGTMCYRQRDGKWRIAHEHFSAPFDPTNNKALTELEPGPTEQATAA